RTDGSVTTSPQAAVLFLRFKLLLVTGDVEGARRLAPKLAEAERSTPGMLAVACQEAASARAWPAAKSLLLFMNEAARRETNAELELLRQRQQRPPTGSRNPRMGAAAAAVAAAGVRQGQRQRDCSMPALEETEILDVD
ncbi:hypothetical protein VaNZ11_016320, partial [Volvox africanus]